MQIITTVLSFLLLALYLPTAFAAPTDAGTSESYSVNIMDSIPKGYALEPMTFNGTIGGISVVYDGTIQEVVSHMRRRYPSLSFATDRVAQSADNNVASDSSTIEARYYGQPSDGKGATYCCPVFNQGWQPATSSRIDEGVRFLNRVTGSCGVKARSCARISCSYNAAIVLCNDKYEQLDASCQWVASFATDLQNDKRCGSWEGSGLWGDMTRMVCGQKFSADHNYNVIVNKINC